MSDDHFPEQYASGPHSNAAQEAGLHVAKVTDHRDDDVWTDDQGFLQRFLMDKPATWRTAVQRYWGERCTRRQLASELGVDLETLKNLLRRIRKAAQNGTVTIRGLSRQEDGVRYPGRPHCGINARDIEAICDGDEDALAHCEEYGRLNIIERLDMFSSAITDDLIQTLDHFEANKENDAITSGLLAKADALKAKVVKPDPFVDRPLFSQFPDQRTEMKIPEADESGVTRWKVRIIGRSEAEPIERGRPRKQTQPATEITTARNTGTFFMIYQSKEQSTLSRSEVIRFVRDNELVKQDLAAIANVPAARLSDYLHDKPVSEEYADRIENAVANVIYVWNTFAPIKIALDDADAFWKAVELANKTHAAQNAWEGYASGFYMKQDHNGAAAD